MIHIVFGTRAQLIKIAPVILALKQKQLPCNIVFTGQHKESIDDLLQDFSIDDRLKVVYSGPEISGVLQMFRWLLLCLWRCLRLREELFPSDNRKQDIFLVHGDTLSTLLGALVGKWLRSRVAQVEAGLRSFKLFHPFPEEITRILVFWLCDIAFCPGKWACDNMQRYKAVAVDTQQNTIVDTLRLALSRDAGQPAGAREKYCVVSIHRFENIFRFSMLKNIVDNIIDASRSIDVIFVLHPATRKQLMKHNLYGLLQQNDRIELQSRMDYSKFIALLSAAEFVITDGGSNQEELSYLGIPTFLMRQATERQEGLGANILLGKYSDDTFREFIAQHRQYRRDKTDLSSVFPSNIIVDHLAGNLQATGA